MSARTYFSFVVPVLLALVQRDTDEIQRHGSMHPDRVWLAGSDPPSRWPQIAQTIYSSRGATDLQHISHAFLSEMIAADGGMILGAILAAVFSVLPLLTSSILWSFCYISSASVTASIPPTRFPLPQSVLSLRSLHQARATITQVKLSHVLNGLASARPTYRKVATFAPTLHYAEISTKGNESPEPFASEESVDSCQEAELRMSDPDVVLDDAVEGISASSGWTFDGDESPSSRTVNEEHALVFLQMFVSAESPPVSPCAASAGDARTPLDLGTVEPFCPQIKIVNSNEPPAIPLLSAHSLASTIPEVQGSLPLGNSALSAPSLSPHPAPALEGASAPIWPLSAGALDDPIPTAGVLIAEVEPSPPVSMLARDALCNGVDAISEELQGISSDPVSDISPGSSELPESADTSSLAVGDHHPEGHSIPPHLSGIEDAPSGPLPTPSTSRKPAIASGMSESMPSTDDKDLELSPDLRNEIMYLFASLEGPPAGSRVTQHVVGDGQAFSGHAAQIRIRQPYEDRLRDLLLQSQAQVPHTLLPRHLERRFSRNWRSAA